MGGPCPEFVKRLAESKNVEIAAFTQKLPTTSFSDQCRNDNADQLPSYLVGFDAVFCDIDDDSLLSEGMPRPVTPPGYEAESRQAGRKRMRTKRFSSNVGLSDVSSI